MGDYFRVEVQDLDRLLQQLKQSQEDLRSALNAMRDTGPKTTGSKTLDHACDEFHDSWDDAIKKIADGTAQLEDRLTETRKGYAETEEAIRCAFSGAAA
ncbi:type VII secretion target [Kitasatospora sp. NPDC094015]|uniref:type VII secretion target n=1 Tax=Kitasatospora sp. NPDC094015 TaxID=3155205 RepID=UPI003333D8E6